MKSNDGQLWERFQKLYSEFPFGMAIDLSRTQLDDAYLRHMAPALQKALAAMQELESGGIANPDENRMVGHYWLRNAALAPNQEIQKEITSTIAAVKTLA